MQRATQVTPIRRFTSRQVKERYGDISDTTLWRWIKFRGFPKPLKFAGQNLWPDDGSIEEWEAKQDANAAAGPAEAA